jgi:hypothetical protein
MSVVAAAVRLDPVAPSTTIKGPIMTRLMLLTTTFAFSASVATAAVSSHDLVVAYQAQGYTKIEVTTGPTQIKLEAIKGTSKVEVVYETATGAILSQGTKSVRLRDRGTSVEVSTSSDDFSTDGTEDAGSDDGAGHDMNDDHGDDDDSAEDPGSDDDANESNAYDHRSAHAKYGNNGKHGTGGKHGPDDHGKDGNDD